MKDVEEALKGDDKDAIEARTTTLMTVSQKLGEKMYAQQGGAAEGAAQAGAGPSAAGGGGEAKNDDVVDADYKEVKRG